MFRLLSRTLTAIAVLCIGLCPIAAGAATTGFTVTNNTTVPLAVGLYQAGCLYHGVVQPGQNWQRTRVGAVWFTLKVQAIPPGSPDPVTDWDCAKPIVSAVIAALVAVGTLGVGDILMAPGEAALGATASMGKAQLTQQLTTLFSKHANVQLAGQYGGGILATHCDGAWPAYTVTGGPQLRATLNPKYAAVAAWQKQALRHALNVGPAPGPPPVAPGPLSAEWSVVMSSGTALTVNKTNYCGNNMMTGSPTSKSS
jgi:hypothetical protein